MPASRRYAPRGGFTLVELLVVITIIAVLSALLTVGLWAAFSAGRGFVNANEVNQVSLALEQFHTKYGTYPPDMTDVSDLTINSGGVAASNLSNFPQFNAFITKAYPRADRTAIAAFCNQVRSGAGAMDSAEALAFFLGGTSKDPRYPLGKIVGGNYQPPAANELDIFLEFPAGSLVDADGDAIPEFIQKNAKGAPLVYFDARTYTHPAVVSGTRQVAFANPVYANTAGVVTPYASGVDAMNRPIFFNLKTYQLICAGLDGEFGVVLGGSPSYPVLNAQVAPMAPRVSELDGDNLGNFTSGKTFNAYTAQ